MKQTRRRITILGLFLYIGGLFGCQSTEIQKTYQKIGTTGLEGLEYQFSDRGMRGLRLQFVSDSVVVLTNQTSLSHSHYLFNFSVTYGYQTLDLSTIQIKKQLSADKQLSQQGYVKPYQNKIIPRDSTAVRYIFPDITGDTLNFAKDYNRLQLREFTFDRVRK